MTTPEANSAINEIARATIALTIAVDKHVPNLRHHLNDPHATARLHDLQAAIVTIGPIVSSLCCWQSDPSLKTDP